MEKNTGKDSRSSTLIITTSSTGNAKLTGSADLVGLQGKTGEVLMTASEFEELGERYAEWKKTRNDPTLAGGPRTSIGYCPACSGGHLIMQWSGVACDKCSYTHCY